MTPEPREAHIQRSSLEAAQRSLDTAILATPTSPMREQLTQANILLLGALSSLRTPPESISFLHLPIDPP